MKKVLAAFDLDGTLLKNNSSFSFCQYLKKVGYLTRTDLLYCASLYIRFLFFGLPLRELHVKAFKTFKGKSLSQLESYLPGFFSQQNSLIWNEPALNRLLTLQKEGASILVLSTSPLFLVKPIVEKININCVYGTEYATDKEGCLVELINLMDGKQKKNIFEQAAQGAFSMTFSDSDHDLPFLEASDHPVVVRPNRGLKKLALARSWEIL